MEIVKTPSYTEQLFEIADYIAADSLERALGFVDDLDGELLKLKTFPYRCRRSIYYDSDSIRDLIFKGYCIPYRVETERLLVLGIVKYRLYRAP